MCPLQMHIEGVTTPSPVTKEVDFFQEHEKMDLGASEEIDPHLTLDDPPKKASSEPMSISNGTKPGGGSGRTDLA